MERIVIVVLMSLCLPAAGVKADPNGTVWGAIAGTAAGLIIANNVHGVNPWVAAPVGAVLGGYIGSQYDRYRYDDVYDDWSYGYHAPYYRRGYSHRHDHGGYYSPPRKTVVYVEGSKAKPGKSPAEEAPDVHPGVDLIKVSILNSNGVRTDVPILRVKGRFVGPQGESYDSLPTAEALAKRYGM